MPIFFPARVRARIAAARAGGDDGVAMLLVIMMMMVVTALSVLVLGVVIAQVQPTALAEKRTVTINGAQAGVDATLSEIRSARALDVTSATFYGNTSSLPCTLKGAVGSGSSQAGYTVDVEYYDANPTGLSTAERAVHEITCSAGGTASTPAYALIKSWSTAVGKKVPGGQTTTGDRSIQTLYTFKLTNENVPGGIMYSVNNLFCLEAEDAVAGAQVTYVAAASCVGDDNQQWIYDKDYAIKLSSTLSGTALCLTNPSVDSGGTITLQPCVEKQVNQLWSYEGGAKFRGQNAANTDYGSTCLYAGQKSGPQVGNVLKAGSDGCASANNEWGSFSPEPKVGAGAASLATKQIVNYLEFGRCMDVTNGDINYAYMIVYPCKQDPTGTGNKLNWNHKWYYTEGTTTAPTTGAQQIKMQVSNSLTAANTYCLNAPVPGTSSTNYVTFVKPCNVSDPKQIFYRTWKIESDYAASYTFKDYWGRCLSLGPKAMPSGTAKWSTIVAATCTGGSEQKWNAPAGLQDASISDTREITGTLTAPSP